MSLRAQTALAVLLLTAITMGAAFTIVWQRFVASQRDQLDAALIVIARAEATDAAAGNLDFMDTPGPRANAVGPLPKHGVLYESDGTPVTTTKNWSPEKAPRISASQPRDVGFDFDHRGTRYRGVLVDVPGGTTRILLATPRDDIEDDSAILARAMAIAFVVGCAWAALVAFVVATRLTREHSAVGDVARRVASGDTSARVSFQSSNREMRQLADDINAMIERLVGLNAMQERFIAHAAHELRTPLTALRIEIEHAIRDAKTAEDYEAALHGALDSTRRLTALAEDLLQLARVARVKTPADTAVADLGDAITDAVADVAPLGRSRDVAIVTEPLSGVVVGERRSLARLFRNVLENAIRFSPRSSPVHVSAERADESIEITIQDGGPGIAVEDVERIFEPFARGARAADHEGTGLGLSIARELARSYGGDVRVGTGEGGRLVIALRRATKAAS